MEEVQKIEHREGSLPPTDPSRNRIDVEGWWLSLHQGHLHMKNENYVNSPMSPTRIGATSVTRKKERATMPSDDQSRKDKGKKTLW